MTPSASPGNADGPQLSSTFRCFRLLDPEGAERLMMIGELDLVTVEQANAAIHRAQNEASTLICDLGDVWFVDLSGLRVLLDAAARAKLTGRRLTLVNCPAIVPRMLQLLKLEDALEIEAARTSAAAVTPSRAPGPQLRREQS